MSFRYINNDLFRDQNEELKSVYDKWRKRQFGKRLPVHVFGSGSEGNSVYLKPYKTLIDIGLPYKVYTDYNPTFFLDVDYIIVTHHHGDHLNPGTLLRVLDNHPHIKVITTAFFWRFVTSERYRPEYIKRDKGEVAPFGHDLQYKTDADGKRLQHPSKWAGAYGKHASKFIEAHDATFTTHDRRRFLFEPLTVKHGDIVNLAVQIHDPELDFDFLYASDLDNLGGARSFIDCFGDTQHVTGLNQSRVYTCMFIEANYDEDLLSQWYANLKQYDPESPEYRQRKARADGNSRHISEQSAARYIESHLVEGGLFIPLHASKTFGTLHQG